MRRWPETYASLAATISAREAPHVRLVAVDGLGGGGKSTFARRLARVLGGCPVVPTDGFATGEPGDEWWPRLERQVIRPLLAGDPGRYRRWDWTARRLAEWHDVPPADVVILKGIFGVESASRPGGRVRPHRPVIPLNTRFTYPNKSRRTS